MTTHQHLILIACLAIATWLWLWPVAPGMIYFFCLVNGDIPWHRHHKEG